MPLTANPKLIVIILMFMISLAFGCNEKIDGYTAATSITQNGFVREGFDPQEIQGQEIKVWGFVDYSNMYGDDGVRKILEAWWSGQGSSATTWRFNLMAKEHEEGRSFAVYVFNDQGRDGLLKVFLKNAKADRPTQVFVKGKGATFNAPTNVNTLTGLYLEVQSSQDILLELPQKE